MIQGLIWKIRERTVWSKLEFNFFLIGHDFWEEGQAKNMDMCIFYWSLFSKLHLVGKKLKTYTSKVLKYLFVKHLPRLFLENATN